MKLGGLYSSMILLLLAPLGVQGQYRWLYPVNRSYYSMSDGQVGKSHEVMFEKSAFGQTQLYGEGGWTGAVYGRKAVVRQSDRPDQSYVFENGIATSATKADPPARTLSSLYRSDNEIQKEVAAYAGHDIWGGDGRFRVLSKNPNIDGALFSLLTLLFLGFAFRVVRLPVRLTMGAFSFLSFGALLLTGSRGALVATVVPAAVMAFFELRRRLTIKVWLCGFLACFCVVGLALCLHLGDRFTRGLFATDASNSLRLSILREVPAMVAESPTGMGFGNSGANYLVWYRIEDKLRTTRTLISSHLTWYVELGHFGRLAYALGWLALMAFLAMFAWRGGMAAALGLWLSIFLSGCFNPVLEDWRLWILPLVSTSTLFFGRRMISKRIALTSLAIGAAGAVLLLSAIILVGRSNARTPSLRIDSERVYINGAKPEVWVVGDHQVLCGAWTFAGDEIMAYFEKEPDSKVAIGYVESIDALPHKVDRLVLAGRQAERFLERWKDPKQRETLCHPDSLLLISPSVPATEFPPDIAARGHIRAVVGSLAAELSPAYSVKDLPSWIRIVRGSLLYIPNWIGLSTQF